MSLLIFQVVKKSLSFVLENKIKIDDLMIELKSNFTQHGILDMEKLVHNVQPIEEGNNLTCFDGSWKQITQLNFLKERIDMRSQRVGTFFIKAFHDNVHLRNEWGKELDEIFKLPNEEVP